MNIAILHGVDTRPTFTKSEAAELSDDLNDFCLIHLGVERFTELSSVNREGLAEGKIWSVLGQTSPIDAPDGYAVKATFYILKARSSDVHYVRVAPGRVFDTHWRNDEPRTKAYLYSDLEELLELIMAYLSKADS